MKDVINIRLMHYQHFKRGIAVIDLPIVFSGTIEECNQWCRDRKYSFLKDENNLFGGHYYNTITGSSFLFT